MMSIEKDFNKELIYYTCEVKKKQGNNYELCILARYID